LRFGEKGPLSIEFAVRTEGAHGTYTLQERHGNRNKDRRRTRPHC
jgi:hypothetical protein